MDGQLSREDLEEDNSEGDGEYVGNGQKASDDVLSGRRMVKVARGLGRKNLDHFSDAASSRRDEFLARIRVLNKSFASWAISQCSSSPTADLTAGMQDYISYVDKLERRYMRQQGIVLSFGSGDCGQLAHGDEQEDLLVKHPRVVRSLQNKRVVSIACGGLHNAIVTAVGEVFTWGCNDDGSLGRGKLRDGEEQIPGRVSLPQGMVAVQVACGDCQTMAVMLDGSVYGLGCYKDKEGKQWFEVSGQNEKSSSCKRAQWVPQRVPGLSGVAQVACGASFNVAVLESGGVLSWGIGECGELGRSVPPPKKAGEEVYDIEAMRSQYLQPSHMVRSNGSPLRTGVKGICCGGYHCLLVMALDAEVLSVGLNNYGQLGLGDEKDRSTLETIQKLEGCGITDLAAGNHHSVVLSAHTGLIWAFGRKDSGQLGDADSLGAAGSFENQPIRVTLDNAMGHALHLSCGANHNLCLTDRNELYTWGYGDMYALGHGNDCDQTRPRLLNFEKAGLDRLVVLDMSGGGQHSAIVGEVSTTS